MGIQVKYEGQLYNLPDKFKESNRDEMVAFIVNKSPSINTEEDISITKDALMQVASGANKGMIEAAKTALVDIPKYLESKVPFGGIGISKEGISLTKKAPITIEKGLEKLKKEVTVEGKTTTGRVVGGIAQFAAPFGVISKGMSSVSIANNFVKAMAAGAVTDFSAFDPHEKRISNLIQEHPSLQNPITEYLQSDEKDSVLEGRMKQTIEGVGLGVVAEGLFKGLKISLRAIKGMRKAKEIIEKPAKVEPPKASIISTDTNVTKAIKETQKELTKNVDLNIADAQPKLFQRAVKDKVVKDITDGADEALRGNYDSSKKIFEQISDYVAIGEIQPEDLPELLAKYDMSPAEFAQELKTTWSAAGRALGNLSHTYRRLQKTFEKDEAAQKILDSMSKETRLSGILSFDSGWDAFGYGWRRLEDFRRSLLVTQVGTAVRNTISQAGRIGIGDIDEILHAAIRGTINKGKQISGKSAKQYPGPLQELSNISLNTTALVKRLNPANRKIFNTILETKDGAMLKARSLSTPVHEVVAFNKISKVLNTLNRAQELQFRKIALESKIRHTLNRKGLAYSADNFSKLSKQEIDEIIEHSLEMTFAASPKGRGAKQLVNFWSKTPLTLINPFPRFQFGNALPFVWKHSPFGLLSTRTLKALFKPDKAGKVKFDVNSKEIANILSKATVGSAMWYGAWNLRQSHGGDKWYEIKTGETEEGKDKIIDMRAYAPITSFLFLAAITEDYIKGTNKIQPGEIAKQLIGLNRISGSGVALFDILRHRDPESTKNVVAQVAGQYLGSFSVPLRQLRDALSTSPEESILRDTRENPLWAPFVNNLPVLSQLLNPAFSPFEGVKGLDPRSAEFEEQSKIDTAAIKFFNTIPVPIGRQIFGISLRHKDVVQKEVDRLDVNKAGIYPRTGVKKADRLIVGYTGWFAENFIKPVVQSKLYTDSSDIKKKIILKEMYRGGKKAAMGLLAARHLGLFLEARKNRMDDDLMTLSEELGMPIGEKLDNMIEEYNLQQQQKEEGR
jgi:hypothetical protein